MKMQTNITEADQELLQIQRRKSTPKVLIQEFVGDDDSGEDDVIEDSKKAEENQVTMQDKNKPHKIKTHFEIDNVSIYTFLFRIFDDSTRFLEHLN